MVALSKTGVLSARLQSRFSRDLDYDINFFLATFGAKKSESLN